MKLRSLGLAAAVLPLRVEPRDAYTDNGQGLASCRLCNAPHEPATGHVLRADSIHFGPRSRAPKQYPRSTIADWITRALAALDNVPLARNDPRNSFRDAQDVAHWSREHGLDRPPIGPVERRAHSVFQVPMRTIDGSRLSVILSPRGELIQAYPSPRT